MTERLLATLATNTITEPYFDDLLDMKAAQETEVLATMI